MVLKCPRVSQFLKLCAIFVPFKMVGYYMNYPSLTAISIKHQMHNTLTFIYGLF